MMMGMRVALGFRAHSGWAAAVAAGGGLDAPRIVDRRRITIADPEMAGSKQPYHAAAEIPFAEAEALVRKAIDSSRALASEAITATLKQLRLAGHEVVACGIVAGSGKPLPPLDRILASHPIIHTAEGEMFREALVWAAGDCGLPAATVREKEMDAAALGRLQGLGKLLGPPWTQDQKYATVAALYALSRRAAAKS